jgi:hypothetical protein
LFMKEWINEIWTDRSREVALAALLSLVLAMGLTWPVILHPETLLVGHPGNDNWNHVWGYWWVAESLAAGKWPGRTELLSFPDGGTLYFIDTVQVILAYPIVRLWGPAVAFNLVLIFGIALSAFGAWLLARHITGSAIAAGMAMLLYGASPHLLGQAYNGISETVCAGWLPLTLFLLIRLMERPTWLGGLGLGLVAGLCMLTSWYYGLFAGLGGMIILAWYGARQPYVVDWRRFAPRAALSLGTAGCLVWPAFRAFQSSLGADDALVTRDPEFVEASLINHNITDILAFIRPSKTASPDLLALYGEELLIVIYIGWTGILLAGAALVWSRRKKTVAPWIWLGLLFCLFSLGPYLNVGGEYLEYDGQRIPLPFLALYKALPVFDRISHPFRFVVGVNLAVGLAASLGFRHLMRDRSLRTRGAVVAGLACMILLETRLGSPASIPIPTSRGDIPEAYSAMVDDPVEGAVLDLPLTVPNLERAVYVWYQSEHGRPVPWGLNDPMPEQLLKNRLIKTLIRMEASRAWYLAPQLPQLDIVVSARSLVRQGYRYIVVHKDLYPFFKLRQIETVLTGAIGEPVDWADDALLVYTLQPIDPIME